MDVGEAGLDGAARADSGGAGRVERDALGACELPASALYGIGTMRARENFALGGESLAQQPLLLTALAQVKVAAARANADLGLLPTGVGEAIVRAGREVAAGNLAEHFPTEIVQGGGGTSTNTNMNEVLANRANEILGSRRGNYALVHPNDHVNRCQSTNDVLPTAMSVAVYLVSRETLESLGRLRARLEDQAKIHEGTDHLGRTCLQDAVPIPVSDVHRTQAHSLTRAMAALDLATQALLSVPLGGTAVGTGFGAVEGFKAAAHHYLREETGLSVEMASDAGDGLASLEPFAAVADAMAHCGRVSARIAADLRLLASGPVGGIGEVELPAVQAGSSMMPGKVNPVIPELVMQVSFQLSGAAHVIHAAAVAGELEVTPMGPVVTAELLNGLQRLGRVAVLFADRCVQGMRWRQERVTANLRGSLHEAVESAATHGYDRAASVVNASRSGQQAARHDLEEAGHNTKR